MIDNFIESAKNIHTIILYIKNKIHYDLLLHISSLDLPRHKRYTEYFKNTLQSKFLCLCLLNISR